MAHTLRAEGLARKACRKKIKALDWHKLAQHICVQEHSIVEHIALEVMEIMKKRVPDFGVNVACKNLLVFDWDTTSVRNKFTQSSLEL